MFLRRNGFKYEQDARLLSSFKNEVRTGVVLELYNPLEMKRQYSHKFRSRLISIHFSEKLRNWLREFVLDKRAFPLN